MQKVLIEVALGCRPGDEVVDYKVREVDRVTPDLCEGAPVVTPANVSGTGNLTGAGITTAGECFMHMPLGIS